MLRQKGRRSNEQRGASLKGIREDNSPQFLASMMMHRCHPQIIEQYMAADKGPNERVPVTFDNKCKELAASGITSAVPMNAILFQMSMLGSCTGCGQCNSDCIEPLAQSVETDEGGDSKVPPDR